MYGYVWLFRVMYGYVGLCMPGLCRVMYAWAMYGYAGRCRAMYGYVEKCMAMYGYVGLCMPL